MSCTPKLFALVLMLADSVSCAWAQNATAAGPDSALRSAVEAMSATAAGPVRMWSRQTGRLEGFRVHLAGDSVLLDTDTGARAVAVANIDSVWVRRGTAAIPVGIIAAVPCAVYLGLVGFFIGGDPDSNGSPARAPQVALIGSVTGGVVCGAAGAGIGSLIKRWRLEYARPARAAT